MISEVLYITGIVRTDDYLLLSAIASILTFFIYRAGYYVRGVWWLISCLILIATILYVVMELSMTEFEVPKTWLAERWPTIVPINILTMFIIILFLYGVFGSWLVSTLVIVVFTALFSIINHYTMVFHGTFLTLEDINNIRTVNNVISTYHFNLDSNVIVIIVLSIICLLLCLVTVKYDRGIKIVAVENRHGYFLRRVVSRLSFAFIPAVVFYTIYLGNAPLIPPQENQWSWHATYGQYGFVIGTVESTISNLGSVVSRPGYYDDTHVADVSENVLHETKVNDEKSYDYPDIIFILNESYYDLGYVHDLTTDVEYMSNYDNMTNCTKGYTVVPMVGGGTNASEYEILTANSVGLINVYAPYNRMNLTGEHSIVDYLEQLGYSTVAAHPASAMNYKRGVSWSQLGFDYTYFENDFESGEYYASRIYNNCITDSSALKNAFDFLDSMSDDKPRFLFLLTMQSHGDWLCNSEENDLVHAEVNSDNNELNRRVNEYLSCIKLTDDMIGQAVDYLEELYEKEGRKVVLCMTGDHAPSFIDDYGVFFDSVDTMKYRSTPYFIWCNYPNERLRKYENANIMDLCYLTPIAADIAGVPMSGYYKYMLDMRETVSVMTNVGQGYYDSNLEYHDYSESDDNTRICKDYFCLEYNNCGKNAKRQDEFFMPLCK